MKGIFGMVAVVWATVSAAQEVPCQVDSTNDGKGLFTYTFHHGSLPYVWLADSIAMRSYGILEVQEPTGWTHSISEGGWIVWRATNGAGFLDEPVSFAVRSSLAEERIYDDWWPPGPFQRGSIGGAVYDWPARTNYLGGGYQNFVFTGPAWPTLGFELNDTNLVLRWSTLSQGCRLEAAEELRPQTAWTPVTNAPVIVATNYTVTLPKVGLLKYFRLATPTVQLTD